MIMELLQLILVWIGIYAVVNISLNIEYGYTGIPNFGRHFAVLIGAIMLGGAVNRILMAMLRVDGDLITGTTDLVFKANSLFAAHPIYGLVYFFGSLTLAFLFGALLGALFILPSARLKGDYLGMTLLAIGEVMFLLAYYTPSLMGGYYGTAVPDPLAFLSGSNREWVFIGLVLLVMVLVFIFAEKLLNTPFGRLLKAHRENEEVVKAFGRDVMRIRIKASIIGSGIAALGGVLYGFHALNLISSAFTRIEWAFYPFIMILLGGRGNNRGVLLGTAIFVTLKVLIETYKFQLVQLLHIPFEPVWLEYILFGVLALLIIYYRPEGLIREGQILTGPIKRLRDGR
ncbi:branched-chain amino acid ABC transporter permease [Thermococcus sp. GR6]|uniref:branched-chain amino acid ABC transporter permease n=1 Tax=Thermococcus sp. GR6 TaxID=1638256 RepID=UPI0014321004|nr:branched-chain amino acid ABC transporter permease [Thermococcus sp. GR6]NJE42628.1 branched-chain amino acid ABC transporter permease [Thermococcus sp. GR6]